MGQDKMQFADGARSEARAGPLRRKRLAVGAGQRDRYNSLVTDLTARDWNSHRDMGTVVPPCGDGKIKRRRCAKDARGSREVNSHEGQSFHTEMSGAPRPG